MANASAPASAVPSCIQSVRTTCTVIGRARGRGARRVTRCQTLAERTATAGARPASLASANVWNGSILGAVRPSAAAEGLSGSRPAASATGRPPRGARGWLTVAAPTPQTLAPQCQDDEAPRDAAAAAGAAGRCASGGQPAASSWTAGRAGNVLRAAAASAGAAARGVARPKHRTRHEGGHERPRRGPAVARPAHSRAR